MNSGLKKDTGPSETAIGRLTPGLNTSKDRYANNNSKT